MVRALAPRFWGAHLLGLVLVIAAGLLGYWQLQAWQASRAAEAVDLSAVAPVPLADLIGPDTPFPGDKVGQPVEVAGTWVPSGTIYISDRVHDGQDGMWMVTPLEITGSGGSALPIVLGWVPSVAAAPAAPVGSAALDAYLQPTEGTGAVDDDPNDDVLPQLRTADVIQHVDQDLYGAYAVARVGVDGLPAADLAALPEVAVTTALRNFLYALEWWIFGGFAAFIWWRYVRDQLLAERAAAAGPVGGDSEPDDPTSPDSPEDARPADPRAEPVERAPEPTAGAGR